MAYPPTVPPNNRANGTATFDNHPGDHNAIADALNDIVAILGATPEGAAADLTARLASFLDASDVVDTLADDAVATAKIVDLAVTAAKIANTTITAGKLATNAVETAKINALAVTAAKLATNAVETAKIKDLNVTTGKLAAAAVTLAKMDAGSGSTAWQNLTLKNSWVAYGAARVTPRIRKILDVVYIEGVMKNGTDTAGINVFNLPDANYHPAKAISVPVACSEVVHGGTDYGVPRLLIQANGFCNLYGVQGLSTADISWSICYSTS